MKKAATCVGVMVVLMLVFVLFACDFIGGSSGTLTVEITGYPPGTRGNKLYMELYEGGAGHLFPSLLATGSILLGTEYSDVMEDPITSEYIVLDAGDYDLYLWIDMNDNIDTIQEPEKATDMTYKSFPLRVMINGDTTVVLTANNFELILVQLDGTWNLTTIPDNSYPPVGDGTYTITLTASSPELEIDYYSGDGVIGGVNYKVNISRKWTIDGDGNDYYLFIYKEGESLAEDSIKCYGMLSGTNWYSGQYEGRGTSASYGTGTFSTIKQ